MDEHPRIPGHTLLRLLGKGGMGAVYLARQDGLDRTVALKVTLATLGELDETFAQRFVKEARTTASLRHPNIIAVYDSGEVDGRCYMSMEYVEGGSLDDLLAIRRLSVDEVIDIGKGVCGALDYAHRAGFVHRDIKPENIMLDGDGNPIITDFGIVKSIHSASNLTGTNATVGSPSYMSPEQLMGDKNIDGRADIYSLGIVLYEMLEGRPPFDDEEGYAVGMKHLTEKPPPLSPMNSRFQGLLDRMLKKNPDQRISTADDVAQALERLRSHTAAAPFAAQSGASAAAGSRRPRMATPPSFKVERASLMRRMGSSARPGRWALMGLAVVLVVVWAVWLRDVRLQAIQYEVQGLFGSPMERFLVGQALFDRGNTERARFWMTQAMNGGYPGAAYQLGRSYRYQDEARAVRFLEAELNNSVTDDNDRNSALLLGFLLCNGSGTEDCGAAVDTLTELTDRTGDAEAMFRLGEVSLSRFDPPRYDQALRWFTRVSESATAFAEPAMIEIARLYDEGLGVERDRHAATDWTVRAASQPQSSLSSRKKADRRCAETQLRSSACSNYKRRRP